MAHGSGSDFVSYPDSFCFLNHAIAGNGYAYAYITSISGAHVVAGAMLRETYATQSRAVTIVYTASGDIEMLERTVDFADWNLVAVLHGQSPPKGLAVGKSGTRFEAFYSTDGITFTKIGTSTVFFNQPTFWGGLAVTSTDGSLSTVNLNRLVVMDTPPVTAYPVTYTPTVTDTPMVPLPPTTPTHTPTLTPTP